MKFRTELKISPLEQPITYDDALLCLGSCFADEVGARLEADKFTVTRNPLGTLFNPLSIRLLMRRAAHHIYFTPREMERNQEGSYFLYGLPTRFTSSSAEELLDEANQGLERLNTAIDKARHLLITFGTAWVYRRTQTGELVANCHKQPQANFDRKRLSVEDILLNWEPLLARYPDKEFIFTVSPIRHQGDGLEQNSVSKATLRLAVERLVETHKNAHYFPAYELLIDDLRDYRFYADDLCHPSTQAVNYIYEKFGEAAFTPATQAQIGRLRSLTSFVAHRPLNPASERYRAECRRFIEAMEREERENKIDFSTEIAQLKGRL